MRGSVAYPFGFLPVLRLPSGISAQEGHPLVGLVARQLGAECQRSRQDLTLIIDYTPDGAGITGIVNPGYDHAALQNIRRRRYRSPPTGSSSSRSS